jgi:hypothetical protein
MGENFRIPHRQIETVSAYPVHRGDRSNVLNIFPMQSPPKKRLEQVKDQIWLKHYSYRIENSYVQWIGRYILFHKQRS